MNEIQWNIKFFTWLEKVKFDNKLNIANRIIKQDNNVVHEESSSFQSIKIRQGTTKVTSFPNQMVQYEWWTKSLDNVIQKNNYTNTYLKIVG